VAGLDEAHAVLVQAQAVFLRYLRQADLLRCASKESASSTAVWLRNRHRGSVRSAHRLVRLAKRVDAASETRRAGVAYRTCRTPPLSVGDRNRASSQVYQP
jgi:hypothetical protein